MGEDLKNLRSEIDAIDESLLISLSKRMQISKEIVKAKGNNLAFRPGREAKLISRLICQIRTKNLELSPQAALSIWRQIMAVSLGQQNKGLYCAVHPEIIATAVWHLGNKFTVSSSDTIEELFSEVSSGKCNYAFVPDTGVNQDLAKALNSFPDLFLIARTPILEIPNILPAFIIAAVLPDPSDSDVSIFLKKSDVNGLDLVSFEGYHKTTPIEMPYLRLAGIYARCNF